MLKAFKHGEVVGVELSQLPTEAKKLNKKENFYVVGESETHGNDHRVAVEDYVEMYTAGDRVFMKNSEPTKIFCPNTGRHDTELVPAGIWEFKKAKEYDFISQQARDVRD